jgi:hypothetical protein
MVNTNVHANNKIFHPGRIEFFGWVSTNCLTLNFQFRGAHGI